MRSDNLKGHMKTHTDLLDLSEEQLQEDFGYTARTEMQTRDILKGL